MKNYSILAVFSALWLIAAASSSGAADSTAAGIAALKASGALARQVERSGVYNRPPTAKTPDFVVDAGWPQPLPHSWILGMIGGLFVDQHDHIWVFNRPRTLTNEEAALDVAIPGQTNAKGQPVDGLGFARPYGPLADCCIAAPSVLEFDTAGKLLRAWGGPADPGFIGGKCKESEGCIWPNSEHGIYVDQKGNVWLAGNGGAPRPGVTPTPTAWDTNKTGGGDGFLLEFDQDGNFQKRIGGTPKGPNSNDTDGGINGTPLLYQPADMVRDPRTNRLYISDGYGNRHIMIVDADTGKYIGHFGAYGGNPVDDAAAKAAGLWPEAYAKGERHPDFFRNPVHCAKFTNDGKLYICDRGNNRIQIFNINDPDLGKPCSNAAGAAGKCGFLAEKFISERTNLSIGTPIALNFSTDKAQSCLYVADGSNMTIYILGRDNLQELGRFGRSGRMAGDFHWLHQIGVDSKGNIYTGEVDTGKRVQKFVRYGALGCSGTGSEHVGGPWMAN